MTTQHTSVAATIPPCRRYIMLHLLGSLFLRNSVCLHIQYANSLLHDLPRAYMESVAFGLTTCFCYTCVYEDPRVHKKFVLRKALFVWGLIHENHDRFTFTCKGFDRSLAQQGLRGLVHIPRSNTWFRFGPEMYNISPPAGHRVRGYRSL